MGFIEAGLIIYRQFHVEGLTTTTGLWVVAGIGVTVAVKFYWTAIFVTFLAIIILTCPGWFEERVTTKSSQEP